MARLSGDQRTSPTVDDRLELLLIEKGLVSAEEIAACREDQRASGSGATRPLFQVLVQRRLLDADQLVALLADSALAGAAPEGDQRPVLGDRYPVTGRLGQGGMGEVMEIGDDRLGRRVAAKQVRGGAPTEGLLRLVREAQITGQLEHPNIVPVHELSVSDDGQLYFTMKRVEGADLGELLGEEFARGENGRYGLMGLLQIFLKICDAMAFAHARGVIHRDLKPANVMVGEFGEVLVMDWGLAKRLDQAETFDASLEVREILPAEAETPLETRAGAIIGTPAFMAPEQARGEQDIGRAADVYALGAILYQMLSLKPPFVGQSGQVILAQVIAGRVVPPSRITSRPVPWELESVVLKAMAREPAQRYASVASLRADVDAFIEGRFLQGVDYGQLQLALKWAGQHRRAIAVALLLLLTVAGTILAARYRRLREIPGLLTSARQAERSGEHERALGLYARILTIDPTSEPALRRRPRAQFALERQAVLRALTERATRAVETHRQVSGAVDREVARWRAAQEQEDPPAPALEDRERLDGLLAAMLGVVAALEPAARRSETWRPERVAAGRRLARLALASSNYSLADHAYAETATHGVPADEILRFRKEVRTARDRVQDRRAAQLNRMIADIRQDLARADRPGHLPRLDEYVQIAAGFRDAQTVRLLAGVLSELIRKGKSNGQRWTEAERNLAHFACEALGRLRRADATPALARWGRFVEDPPLIVGAARALCRTRRPEAAEPFYQLVRRLEGANQRRAMDLEHMIPVGQSTLAGRSLRALDTQVGRLLKRGEHERALAELNRFSRTLPELSASARAEFYQIRSETLWEAGQIEHALADARKSTREDPTFFHGHLWLGHIWRRSDPARARPVLVRALQLRPGHAGALAERSLCDLALGDLAAARAGIRAALAREPLDLSVLNAATRLALKDGQYDRAEEHARVALRQHPQDPTGHYLLGATMAKRRKWDEALTSYDRALRLRPRLWHILYERASIRFLRKQYRRAAEDLERSLGFQPHARSLMLLGNCQVQLKQYERALATAERFLSRPPHERRRRTRGGLARADAWAWQMIYLLRRKLGRPEASWREARRKFEQLEASDRKERRNR